MLPKKCPALSISDSLACLAVDPVAMRQRTCSSNPGVIPLLNCAWRTAHNLRNKAEAKPKGKANANAKAKAKAKANAKANAKAKSNAYA
jgi:hypothetical protein